MPTRAKSTHVAPASSVTKSAPAHAAAPAAHASPAAAQPSPTPTTPANPLVFLAPPPSSANIPSVPDGFVPTTGASFTGTMPQKAELVALPLAIRDLGKFASYAVVLGGTAPPLDEVLQTFDVTNQWSSMRNASSAWDEYCREHEGIAWRVMRALMNRLNPAFTLAARTNPSLGTTYAGLAALLGAKQVAAHKAVATKKKNKLDVAAGKLPTHGRVGRQHQKTAAKEALAAQNGKLAPQPSAPAHAATPPVEPTPVVPSPVAPSPTTQAPIIAPAAVTNGAPPGANGTPRA